MLFPYTGKPCLYFQGFPNLTLSIPTAVHNHQDSNIQSLTKKHEECRKKHICYSGRKKELFFNIISIELTGVTG